MLSQVKTSSLYQEATKWGSVRFRLCKPRSSSYQIWHNNDLSLISHNNDLSLLRGRKRWTKTLHRQWWRPYCEIFLNGALNNIQSNYVDRGLWTNRDFSTSLSIIWTAILLAILLKKNTDRLNSKQSYTNRKYYWKVH